MTRQEIETQLKELIVQELQLEDTNPAEIDSEAPLFGAGLGLDSIDALELAVAIDRTYGVSVQPDDADNKKIFASIEALAGFILERRNALGDRNTIEESAAQDREDVSS